LGPYTGSGNQRPSARWKVCVVKYVANYGVIQTSAQKFVFVCGRVRRSTLLVTDFCGRVLFVCGLCAFCMRFVCWRVRFVCVLYAGVCGSCAFCMLACGRRSPSDFRVCCGRGRVGVEVLRTSARGLHRKRACACACAGARVCVCGCACAGGSISHRSRSAKVFAPPSFYFIFTSHTHTLPSLFRKCKREKVERVE